MATYTNDYKWNFFHPEYKGHKLTSIDLFGVFDSDGEPVAVFNVPALPSNHEEALLAMVDFVEGLIPGAPFYAVKQVLHLCAAELLQEYEDNAAGQE